MISWMQSLSDLTRTRILRLLDSNELTVMELCSVLQLPQSTVSRHLKTLADDGWIVSRRDGPSNQYSLPMVDLEDSRRRLWDLVREQTQGDLVTTQDESRLQQILIERSSRSQRFFSSAASKWDGLRTDLFGQRLDAWALAALLPADWTVGDLGCGTGELVAMLAPHVRQVFGFDSSSAMLESARTRLLGNTNVTLSQADLTDLPLGDAKLDAAVLSIVLPYVAEPARVFEEASRVTKVQGRLVVIDLQKHDRTEYRQELNHTWLGFEREQLQGWLELAGWKMDSFHNLPPQADAMGPNLFMSIATRI